MADSPPPIPLDPEHARARRRPVAENGGDTMADTNGTTGRNGHGGANGAQASAAAATATVPPLAPPQPSAAPSPPGGGADGTIPSRRRAPGGPGGDDGDLPPAGSGSAQIRVKRLRLAVILIGLGAIALTSTVFGMMMAVAEDLPALEDRAQYARAQNSLMLAANEQTEIAKLTGNLNRILLEEGEISPNIQNAVVAIEDRRFYEHEGVDFRGIARALWQDIRRAKAVQGGSTITQQFVKNAQAAQGERTVFQKLREAALAYHLERKWTKNKVLTQYLNNIYFGNGAYGIESAVRTYFRGGDDEEFDLSLRAASEVEPHEAALLAAIIASPSAFDPVQNPRAATERRNLVLRNMLEQGFITREQYEQGIQQAVPTEKDVDPPSPDSREPYFSTWVTQQLVDLHGAGRVFGGGLRVTTTLDTELQEAAENAINERVNWPGGPTASLVAIENKTGAVKAMVGGTDFEEKPFNLATNGHRQPGSAIKPFTLIGALNRGVSPDRTFASELKMFNVPRSPGEKFVVRNYESSYAGVTTLADATARSDNSVYAELGVKIVGTRRIARLARRMGVRTPVSTNPAMTLGGLEEGLTPLELTYAYSTIANRGERRSGTLAASKMGPVAIQSVTGGGVEDRNKLLKKRVYPKDVGETTRQLLRSVVTSGTGTKASLGTEFAAGKTGTTENYGDAWFCGFTDQMTACVWVGYPDKLQYMTTEYHGQAVAGGTFPAEIWRDFMLEWIRIREARDPDTDDPVPGAIAPSDPSTGVPSTPVPSAPEPSAPSSPAPEVAPAPSGGGGGGAPAPSQPAPAPQQPPSQPQQPPSSGGSGGSSPSTGSE